MIDYDRLFWLIEERNAIRIRRLDGADWPWSGDAVLNYMHFPNTRRAYDPTSVWIKRCVVEPLRGSPKMARAVAACRLINRLSILTHLRPLLLEPYPFDKWAKYVARVLRVYRGKNRLLSPAANTSVSVHVPLMDGLLATCWIFDNEPDVLNTSYVETAHAAVQKRIATGIARSLFCPIGYEMALDVVGETAVDRMTWANISRPIAKMLGFSAEYTTATQRRFIPVLHALMEEADRRGAPFARAEDAERSLQIYCDYQVMSAKWSKGDRHLHPYRWFRKLKRKDVGQ